MRRLHAELVAMGIPRRVAAAAVEEAVRDSLRARLIAESYSKRWLRAAEAGEPADASAATVGSVRTIATTESAEAYNGGRLIALRNYPGIQVMRVWDSTLDRATCPICANADGDIVGVMESFPSGEPGAVHPNCRCTWQPVTLQEV